MTAMSLLKTAVVFTAGFFAGAYFVNTRLRSAYDEVYREKKEDLEAEYKDKYDRLDDIVEEKSLEKGRQIAIEKIQVMADENQQVSAIYDSTTRTHEILRPDELGETGYDVSYLTYHPDGTLTYDSDGSIAEEPERVVGPIALKNFGLYEPDIIHVRNHLFHKDYEVIRSGEFADDPNWIAEHTSDDSDDKGEEDG